MHSTARELKEFKTNVILFLPWLNAIVLFLHAISKKNKRMIRLSFFDKTLLFSFLFNGNYRNHSGLSVNIFSSKRVRGTGFEPANHCWNRS